MNNIVEYINNFLILFSIFIGLIGILNARHTIYSLIWLIYIFLSSALFFILQGADFIGLTIVIIYVGAIAMLFLYTVMLFDPRYSRIRQKRLSGLFKIFFLLYFLSSLPWAHNTILDLIIDSYDYWYNYELFETSIDITAHFLYAKYSWLLIIIGMFLLVGMVIAIDIAYFYKDIQRIKK